MQQKVNRIKKGGFERLRKLIKEIENKVPSDELIKIINQTDKPKKVAASNYKNTDVEA